MIWGFDLIVGLCCSCRVIGVGRTGWHIDGTFQPAPYAYSLYYMASVPKQGATVFAPLTEVIEGLSSEKYAEWDRLWMLSDRRSGPVHPLIYTHPRSKKKVRLKRSSWLIIIILNILRIRWNWTKYCPNIHYCLLARIPACLTSASDRCAGNRAIFHTSSYILHSKSTSSYVETLIWL